MNFRTKLIQRLVHINEAIFFYPKLRRFYKDNLLNENSRIIDVGANKGQSIDFFLKIHPQAQITAFEPNAKLFALLKGKYASRNNIVLHNFGIRMSKPNLNSTKIFWTKLLHLSRLTSTRNILKEKRRF